MQEPFEEEGRSWWSRLKERLFGPSEEEDDGGTVIRLHTRPAQRVHVLYARSMEDARRAADGLKAGHQQLVNFQYAEPRLRERVVDFLMGVVYALEGTVERVHEQVFLFAPANVQVEMTHVNDFDRET
ncbi:MAG: cell division protein SepF [Armatimonadota bacterium]|nr:cell division protein SepF [bacterium]MCS7309161.1 cell division protein SepF [Armatimonadota bacterium]MDW8104352.1 cell division protein SepF [Armatimonadota bacterium]MDW8289376.1 cell division protein SepF [Armatimonadota bacterium]